MKLSKCCEPRNKHNNSLSWRWDKADLSLYYFKTLQLSQSITVPTDLLRCEYGLFKCTHWSQINQYYDSVVHVLQQSMYECIPAVRNNFYKAFWTEELTALKQASIDAHNRWRLCDAPRSGLVNKIRLEAKYKYKMALKQAMINYKLELDDEISNLYLRKDMDKFWQQWNTRFSNKTCKPSSIDGQTDDTAIANHFCDCFASVYFDLYENNVDVVACLEKLQSLAIMRKGVLSISVVS